MGVRECPGGWCGRPASEQPSGSRELAPACLCGTLVGTHENWPLSLSSYRSCDGHHRLRTPGVCPQLLGSLHS